MACRFNHHKQVQTLLTRQNPVLNRRIMTSPFSSTWLAWRWRMGALILSRGSEVRAATRTMGRNA
eukprot:3562213-Amphidinium_carterae.1